MRRRNFNLKRASMGSKKWREKDMWEFGKDVV